MNPLDWIISLLPHPRKRSRTSAAAPASQPQTTPVLRQHAEIQPAVKPASPPAPIRQVQPEFKPAPPPTQPVVLRRAAIPLPTPAAVQEFEDVSQQPAAPTTVKRPAWRNLAMAGIVIVSVLLLGSILFAFASSAPGASNASPASLATPTLAAVLPTASDQSLTPTPFQPATRPPDQPIPTPTPDVTKPIPTARAKEEQYVVQPNDSLNIIAKKYNVDIQDLVEANKIANPNQLTVGQKLVIPVVTPRAPGPAFKIIPDSELVLSPHTIGFSVQKAIAKFNGYLIRYEEKVDDRMTSGVAILERISREYSVNPRLLLAVLDYQSGWVTQSNTPDSRKDYPMGHINSARKGLYRQLAWAANQLNQGYYLWRVNGLSSYKLSDGSVVPASTALNAGTVGVQNLMSELYDRSGWERAISEKGVFAVYSRLFGYSFDYAFEPVLPVKLTQPKLRLPIEDGTVWSFTGAPHGGWGDGSAWAALDFAPPGDAAGCVPSAAWVTAVADGLVVRSENGVVVLDLDQDGNEQTGWTILYLHISSGGRVKLGARLKSGDRIGHPSCEGGVSNGTHVHIARRYNGEWIPADGPLPFNMDGWISEGAGVEYYGYLRRNGEVLEAWDRRVPANQITR